MTVYRGEEKMKIGLGWGNMGALISYLEDCDVEEGKELVFVGVWIATRTIG